MFQNILQGAATLSVAILATDAIKETATHGPHSMRKWMAVIIVLITIAIIIEWLKPTPVPIKSTYVT